MQRLMLALVAGLFLVCSTHAAFGEGRLIGTYRNTKTTEVGVGVSVDVASFLELRGNGTCRLTNRERGGPERGSLIGRKARPLFGTWHLDGRRMVLRWDNGLVESLRYEFIPRPGGSKLLLRAPGSSSRMWEKVR